MKRLLTILSIGLLALASTESAFAQRGGHGGGHIGGSHIGGSRPPVSHYGGGVRYYGGIYSSPFGFGGIGPYYGYGYNSFYSRGVGIGFGVTYSSLYPPIYMSPYAFSPTIIAPAHSVLLGPAPATTVPSPVPGAPAGQLAIPVSGPEVDVPPGYDLYLINGRYYHIKK